MGSKIPMKDGQGSNTDNDSIGRMTADNEAFSMSKRERDAQAAVPTEFLDPKQATRDMLRS